MNSRICAIFSAALILGGTIYLAFGQGDGSGKTHRGATAVPGLAAAHPHCGIHRCRSFPRLLDPDGDDDDATPISELSVWQPDDDRVLAVVGSGAFAAPAAEAAAGGVLIAAEPRSLTELYCGAGSFFSATSLESLCVRLQI